MLILTIRTDKPDAELGLFKDDHEITYLKWQAHRQLSATIHLQAETIIKKVGKSWGDIKGVVCYKGPGSFTGLRIGIATANALADSLGIPIIGTNGPKWLDEGIKKLLADQNDKLALPEYGAPVKTTPPSS